MFLLGDIEERPLGRKSFASYASGSLTFDIGLYRDLLRHTFSNESPLEVSTYVMINIFYNKTDINTDTG